MKLRNKKTDEIVNAWSFYDDNKTINLKYFNNDGQVNLEYDSLAKLYEEWEDYKPTEPLIKDRAIRKAVRAWAEAEKVTNIRGYQNTKTCEFYYKNMEQDVYSAIQFIGDSIIDKSLNHNVYTITELCGEEAIKDEG